MKRDDMEKNGTEKSGMGVPRISESEWQIMELVWAGEAQAGETQTEAAGITQAQLMLHLEKRWNKNTVHTFLTRLCEKGFLEVDRKASPHRYHALISREICEGEERRSFLERVYQGSAGRMVASFVKDGGLSREEADQLRKMLDEIE